MITFYQALIQVGGYTIARDPGDSPRDIVAWCRRWLRENPGPWERLQLTKVTIDGSGTRRWHSVDWQDLDFSCVECGDPMNCRGQDGVCPICLSSPSA